MFDGQANVPRLGRHWRQAPPDDVSTLLQRLRGSGLGFFPPLVAPGRPNATLSVPGCVPPVQLQFETLAEDPASTRSQRALDDVLDTLYVRPLARLGRPRSP